MRSKVSSDWLPSYIKATRPVLEIFKMVGYFLDSPRILVDRYGHFGATCCLRREGRRALNFQALHPVFVCGISVTEAVSQNNEVSFTIHCTFHLLWGVVRWVNMRLLDGLLLK